MRFAFCLHLVALELALRGPAFYLVHPRALGYLAASAALLYLVASLPPRRLPRALAALLLGIGLAVQVAYFRYYHALVDDQAAVAARLAWADIQAVILHAAPALVGLAVVAAAIEYAWLSRAAPRRPRRRAAAVVLALGVLVGGTPRHATLEIRSAYAAGSFALAPGPSPRATHHALPPLVSRRSRVPNVLLIVTESVRASEWCGDPGEPCPLSPEVHALLPGRVPLLEMRTAASYTAIAMSALLTSLPQVGARDAITAAPDLFDLARATREGDRPLGVHYLSSQSPSFFERSDVAASVDTYLTADTFLGHETDDIGEAVYAGLDRRLADECRARFPAMTPPYLAMVHLSGTHAPYFFDEEHATYRPFGHTVNFSGMADLHRSYENAILEQDRSIAGCLRAFLDAQRGAPYFVLFTSDHGESFGERWAIHHGQNLYDEQVHVPAFVTWGGGALSPEEERALTAARTAFVTHFDVLPTLLDVLGVLDHFALAPEVGRMQGRSLLRPAPAMARPLPITNCSAMWKCPLDTWGVFAGDRKLIEQAWDGAWRCVALRGGEHEEPLDRCQDLVSASRGFFPLQPNGARNE